MFELTQEERKAILFLIAIALFGVGTNCLAKYLSPTRSLAYFTNDLGKVNLNSADKKLLMGISGIGEKLAERIIDYRQERAGFNNIDEIKEIKGITDAKFAKIREYLKIE